MKYSILTFGCRVNHADSLRIEEDLRARGGVEAAASTADLVVVNTCSVTATADQGARQTIRRIARENPHAQIIATGCYATRCGEEVATLPGVIRVVRNADKAWLAESVLHGLPRRSGEAADGGLPRRSGEAADGGLPRRSGEAADGGLPRRSGEAADGGLPRRSGEAAEAGPCGAAIEPGIAGRTAFTIRAQTGCEERCAYCIIPSTRGASRSASIASLIADVRRVAAAGFKEVVVTGVHLGSYGRDLTPAQSLLDLLHALDRVPEDVTFRISSLEPMDCTTEIVSFVAGSGRFMPHFHLPLQHASDRMLAAMRRPYTLDYYRRLVDGIAAKLPHASIGSDLIAGFPGETEEDFAANVEYLPASSLTHLHVFPYSDRPGTAATAMRDKVHGSVIRDRAAQLRDIGVGLSRRFRQRQAGTIRSGLTLEDGTLVVTDNYLKVRIAAGLERNVRVQVRLGADASAAVITPASASPDAVQVISGGSIR